MTGDRPQINGSDAASVAPRANADGATRSPRALLQHHLTDLRRSGLDDETIRLSGIYSETSPECIAKLLGWERPARDVGAALVIPFSALNGEATTYTRLKLDKPVTHKGAGAPAKYESPIGRSNCVYLPPRLRAAVSDPSVPLLLTEGEKKALAGDQHGHACAGLVGVWGWVRAQSEPDPTEGSGAPKPLHPDLEALAVRGRRIYVVYDSDAVFKWPVRHAEWHLVTSLAARGADVRVVRLPCKIGAPKVGLDDYFLNHTDAEFEKLLGCATFPTLPPTSFSNVAYRLNKDKPDEPIAIPRSLEEMAVELVGVSKGWPRLVGGLLVVPDGNGAVRGLKSYHDLVAFAGSVFDANGEGRVRFTKLTGAPTPQTFFAALTALCERFDRADPLPHEPPIPNVLYTKPAPRPDGKFEALERFLAFFSPASDEDKSLLLAALLTTFWGGPAGKRPAFLFEAEEDAAEGGRGVGKSTAAVKIASVSGGAFDIDASEPFARTRSRLLTPEAGSYRVLLMDNVKTFRLSSADLEGLITNPFINGHRLYHGQAGVPNLYALFITLNGASLSRDMAQRVIPVRLTRASYRGSWEADLDAFVSANRDRLIGDIVGSLRGKPGAPPRVSRWGRWEADVLARVPLAARCAELIDERTRGMDADQEDGDRIRDTWARILERSLSCADPHGARFLLRSPAVTKLVELATNQRYSAASASAQMAAFAVKGFRKSPRNGERFWLWEGDRWKRITRPPAPPVVTYDPEREEWSKEITSDSEATVEE